MHGRQLGKSDDSDGEPGPSGEARRERWTFAAFTSDLFQFQAEDDMLHEREDWHPLDYVEL